MTPRSILARAAFASALLLHLAVAAPAAAQSADQRLAERLGPEARAPIVSLIDSARAAGLPTEPLVQKALQGAMRGAETDRIVTAVRRLAGDLGVARAALGPRSTPAELEAGASAVRAGATPQVLASLRAAQVRSSLTVALGTLADLMGQGVPVDTALAMVTSLVRRGAVDEEYVALRRRVDPAEGRGRATTPAVTPPGQSVERGSGAKAGNARGGGAPASVPRPGGARPKPAKPNPARPSA